MLKKLFAAMIIAAVADTALAQDSSSVSPLEISGSVDAYYKYDFAGLKGAPGISRHISTVTTILFHWEWLT